MIECLDYVVKYNDIVINALKTNKKSAQCLEKEQGYRKIIIKITLMPLKEG